MKKLLIIMAMMMPTIIFANTCDVAEDTQTGNTRTLVCDDTRNTTTKFKVENSTVVDNDVCRITCSEEVIYMIDPIKKVLAGTGFSYPLYTSGERKCVAQYKYSDYETKMKRLVSEYESLEGSAKATKANEIENYYEQKKACDEFTKSGSDYEQKYKYETYDIGLQVETSTNVETIPYEFKEMSDYSSTVILEEVTYNSCNYNETTKKCDYSDTTISGWTEIARIYGKYTMKDTYMENYTGKTAAKGEKTCNAGDRFFTSLTELTRPVANDTTDKGYSLKLSGIVGNNIGAKGTNNKLIEWNLNVDCWYQVKNLIFPQNKPGVSIDEYYEEYGGTAFQYRIIDLNNPFPGRAPGANWVGKESIITSTKDNLSTLERFEINLNRSAISQIRQYNDTHSYESFNIEEKLDKEGNKVEYSSFVEAFNKVINRK